ncbi:hypothetical protein DPEC_G00178020 [Dallia pectoralis]|uniref:Uncharacterized protein n=1 Tax=Dallia pectoralis TaxID=75939 RepID=A0ACC2GFC5_DALPE|nr:hypothetical protein DPEC_G00178020 [Dallia pectoralis]
MERPQLLRPPWPGLDIRCSWPAQTDSTCLQYHTTEDPIVEEACLAPWNMRRTNSAQRAPWPNERNRRALYLCLLSLRSRWIVGVISGYTLDFLLTSMSVLLSGLFSLTLVLS